LREIKDGILNLITGKDLAPEQMDFFSFEKEELSFKDSKLKELNNFVLFEELDSLSSTARTWFYFFFMVCCCFG
jgi:hypothetical protein